MDTIRQHLNLFLLILIASLIGAAFTFGIPEEEHFIPVFIPPHTQLAAVSDFDANLVAHWKFDETSDTTANDSSGNGNTGTLTNMDPSTDWVAGKIAGALSFDGTDDYVDVGNNDLTGEFTVSLWFNMDTVNQTAMITGDGGSGGNRKIGFASGKWFIRVIASGSLESSVAEPSATSFHHAVLTRDSSNKVDLYVDGGSPTRLFSNSAQSGTFRIKDIGASRGNVSFLMFDGLIDDVRIYNRALTQAEVTELYEYTGETTQTCGNSIVEGTESCDQGASNGACPATCSSATCSINSCGGGDTTPPTISNVVATNITTTGATITWDTTDELSHSEVNYGLTTSYTGNKVDSSMVTSHSLTLSNLQPNTLYHYQVRSQDQALNTATDPTDYTFTTLTLDITDPLTPTNLSATPISSTQINLSWSASTDNVGVTGYRIRRGGTEIATVTGTSYSNTGLSPSTSYTYTVSAYDAAGNESLQSTSANATTQSGGNNIIFYQGFETDNDGMGAGAERGPGASISRSTEQPRAGSWSSKHYLLDTCPPSTCSYRAESTPGPGKSKWERGEEWWVGQSIYLPSDYVADSSYEIFMQWHGSPDPGESCGGNPPISLGISDGILSLAVRWTSNPDTCDGRGSPYVDYDGTANYNLGAVPTGQWVDFVWHIKFEYDSTGLIELWQDGVKVVTHNNGTMFNDIRGSGLQMGIYKGSFKYDYRSSTKSEFTIYHDELRIGDLNSSYAEVAPGGSSPITDIEAPSTPTNLTSTPISSSQINLLWNASTDNVGVTGYRIFRDSIQVGTSPTTSFSDTGLSPSTTYTYTVSAYDAAGNGSAQSSPVLETTLIATIATNSLANSITITANSQNFDLIDAPVENLWDGITNSDSTGTAGAGDIASFWVEFDFGENYDLTSAQLFGDVNGSWVSNTWTLGYKQNISDSWQTAFSNVNALFNGWSSQNLTITARYVRVEVFGDPAIPATQARELEIYGTPTTPTLKGDLNNDGTVNSLDWSIVNSAWGTADPTADINNDGVVNTLDWSIMNGEWG